MKKIATCRFNRDKECKDLRFAGKDKFEFVLFGPFDNFLSRGYCNNKSIGSLNEVLAITLGTVGQIYKSPSYPM